MATDTACYSERGCLPGLIGDRRVILRQPFLGRGRYCCELAMKHGVLILVDNLVLRNNHWAGKALIYCEGKEQGKETTFNSYLSHKRQAKRHKEIGVRIILNSSGLCDFKFSYRNQQCFLRTNYGFSLKHTVSTIPTFPAFFFFLNKRFGRGQLLFLLRIIILECLFIERRGFGTHPYFVF